MQEATNYSKHPRHSLVKNYCVLIKGHETKLSTLDEMMNFPFLPTW